MKIQFMSDKVSLSGPRIDGTYKVTLEVGEYERKKLAELLSLEDRKIIKVTIEQ